MYNGRGSSGEVGWKMVVGEVIVCFKVKEMVMEVVVGLIVMEVVVVVGLKEVVEGLILVGWKEINKYMC